MKLFITLDLDTIENSGRITLPEDTLTKVPTTAAWEYCVYIGDNDFGLYKQNGNKVSKPYGMSAEKTFGDSGNISIKIAKSLLDNTPTIRYTLSTYDPNNIVGDTLWQGGSSATDVFPGTPATFSGEINGYGQISGAGILSVTEYTIYYIYDGINPIVEYPASGNPLASYVNAGGMHIGKIAGADSSWYHCDALGSPRKMTDELGSTVTWSGSYYPFGEATTSGTNTHQFTGKEMDAEMGLNYFCQRYYDPQIGRFMTLDPQDSPASSPYAYCANNPLKFTDPTGEKSVNEEIEWRFKDRSMWKKGMENSYTGRPSEHWFLGSSAELDPDFWTKGWDWTSGVDLFKSAVFILSSGIFEFEVLTDEGWQFINIGNWIMEHDIRMSTLLCTSGSPNYSILRGRFTLQDGGTIRINLNEFSSLDAFGDPRYNSWDLIACIAHEAMHGILRLDFGFRNGNVHEYTAYKQQYHLFNDVLGGYYRNQVMHQMNKFYKLVPSYWH